MLAVQTLIIEKPPPVSDRAIKEYSAKSHGEALVLWRDRFLGKHFERGNAARYGFQRRTAKYLARKRRDAAMGKRVLMGGEVDLVRSGTLRRLALSKRRPRVYPTRGVQPIPATVYAPVRPKKPGMPKLREEMKALRGDEAKVLADKYGEAMAYQIIHTTGRRVRRAKG